ncbi:MAG: hypothetical protein ABJG88_05290 [Litorimonas sp.]
MVMQFKFYILLSGLLALSLITPNAKAQISTPEDVNDLVFWVDATDVNGTGNQPTDGSVVTTWVDKSSGGNNLTTTAGTVTFQATGFDGINPGLRFPLTADMDAGNPFSGNFQDEITVFFVSANVTLTDNFSLSLNGHNTSSNPADGRFSFHAPWITNAAFFDAGACCGSTRLTGPFPNAVTETTLYTGLNDANGSSQLLRIDGQAFQSDTTAIIANVSRGIHVGDLPNSRRYDGRFAEILIYDRALTTAEIADVECFLLLKWKLSAAPSGCAVNVTARKTVEVWDPNALGLYALPGNDVIYTISATHESGPALDPETLFLKDAIPSEVVFFNGDIDDAGPEIHPVSFTNNTSSLTFNYPTDVAFSNASLPPVAMTDCTYTPIVGYDPAVTHICIQPTGSFDSGTPNPSFSVSFRARIE